MPEVIKPPEPIICDKPFTLCITDESQLVALINYQYEHYPNEPLKLPETKQPVIRDIVRETLDIVDRVMRESKDVAR